MSCKLVLPTSAISQLSDSHASRKNKFTNTNMKDVKNPEELWTLHKTKLKLMFTHLHDEDFHYDYGEKEVMMTLLQQKLGKTREELNQLLIGL